MAKVVRMPAAVHQEPPPEENQREEQMKLLRSIDHRLSQVVELLRDISMGFA